MFRVSRLFALVLALIMLDGARGVWAVEFKPLSLDQLAADASWVVEGTVAGKRCLRDEAGRIYTQVRLSVTEVWKGNPPGGKLVIAQAGGTLGAHRVTVPGQAEYRLGEEVVVFLTVNARGEGVTLGMVQGKFDVHSDPTTGFRTVRSAFYGRDSVGSKTVVMAASGAEPGGGAIPLQDLKDRVRGKVQR